MKLYEIRIDIPNDRIKRNPYMNQVGQSAGNGLHGKFSLSGYLFTRSPCTLLQWNNLKTVSKTSSPTGYVNLYKLLDRAAPLVTPLVRRRICCSECFPKFRSSLASPDFAPEKRTEGGSEGGDVQITSANAIFTPVNPNAHNLANPPLPHSGRHKNMTPNQRQIVK